MRSQQRTSRGFDSDEDPRLAGRRAAAESQRRSDADDVADEADLTTIDDERPNGSRDLEAVGAGGAADQ